MHRETYECVKIENAIFDWVSAVDVIFDGLVFLLGAALGGWLRFLRHFRRRFSQRRRLLRAWCGSLWFRGHWGWCCGCWSGDGDWFLRYFYFLAKRTMSQSSANRKELTAALAGAGAAAAAAGFFVAAPAFLVADVALLVGFLSVILDVLSMKTKTDLERRG